MIQTLKNHIKITNNKAVLRRYFVMNGFDGVITILGVLLGSYIAQIQDFSIVSKVGLSTTFAMTISGMAGAYLSERAEMKSQLIKMERAMLKDLGNSHHGEAAKTVPIITALVTGFAPFVTSMLVLIPIFVSGLFSNHWHIPYFISFGICFSILFILGLIMGKISQENMILYGFKTVTAGCVVFGMLFLLGQ